MGAVVSGRYVSEDNNFTIVVTSSDDSNGSVEATYNATYSPVPNGNLAISGRIGNYSFIGGSGSPPFAISFNVSQRPEPSRPYHIRDCWVGIYESQSAFLMEGVRSYIDSQGVMRVGSLGTLRFSR